MTEINTDRLSLRLLEESNSDMILELLNEPAFIKNIGDKGVRDLDGALNYINDGPLTMEKNFGFSLYCCVERKSQKPIGISGLIKRDGIEFPEVGFAFLNQYCSKGYGYESAVAVIKYAKETLNMKKIQAICNPENTASNALLAKLCFKQMKMIILPGDEKEIYLYERSLNLK